MEGLTLIPVDHAKPGYRFTFLGPNRGQECEGCPVQKLCFNLEPGARYEVTEVRDVRHPCNLHDEGRVRVAKVQRVGFETSMETKRLRGTAATFVPVDCGMPECANWSLCHPYGVETGIRYGLDEVGKAIDCPMDFKIKRVRLKPL